MVAGTEDPWAHPTADPFKTLLQPVAPLPGGPGEMDEEDDEDYDEEPGKYVLYWEKGFTMGAPPSPRYGHQMVLLHPTAAAEDLPAQGSKALLAQLLLPCEVEVKIAVVGGCAVSPVRTFYWRADGGENGNTHHTTLHTRCSHAFIALPVTVLLFVLYVCGR